MRTDMTRDQQLTPVQVITRQCRYAGLLETCGSRVSDILNDTNTDIVELRETSTVLVGGPSTDVRCGHLYLRKSEILTVIPKGKYEASEQRRNRYVEKPRYGAMVVLPGLVLSGIMHLSSRATPLAILNENSPLSRFMALTGATVYASSHDLGAAYFEVVIMRRLAIESLQLTGEPLPGQEAKALGVEQAAVPWS
jgi:hypothetical protein